MSHLDERSAAWIYRTTVVDLLTIIAWRLSEPGSADRDRITNLTEESQVLIKPFLEAILAEEVEEVEP